jgi:hypothetical protein
MDIETLNKANEIAEEIDALEIAKEQVASGSFLKKTGHSIPQEAIEAGQAAMNAAIDEAIDDAKSRLSKL